MKFEIIHYRRQFTGDEYWKILCDGIYVDGSASCSLQEVEDKLVKALTFREETVKTETVVKTVNV